jgi:hypothetical protein
MIHLSNLELNELSSLFSHRGFRDSSFKRTIIKILCLGKSFFLNQRNNGLHEDDDIAEHMIPATFHEETENQVIAPSETKMTKMLEMIRLIISNAYFYRKENSDYRRKMINIQKRF